MGGRPPQPPQMTPLLTLHPLTLCLDINAVVCSGIRYTTYDSNLFWTLDLQWTWTTKPLLTPVWYIADTWRSWRTACGRTPSSCVTKGNCGYTIIFRVLQQKTSPYKSHPIIIWPCFGAQFNSWLEPDFGQLRPNLRFSYTSNCPWNFADGIFSHQIPDVIRKISFGSLCTINQLNNIK